MNNVALIEQLCFPDLNKYVFTFLDGLGASLKSIKKIPTLMKNVHLVFEPTIRSRGYFASWVTKV